MEVYIMSIMDSDGYVVHMGAYSNAEKAREAVNKQKKDMLEEGFIEEDGGFDDYMEVDFYKVEVDGE